MSAAHARGGPVGVALVGAGVISAQYLKTLSGFPDIRVVAVADLDERRAADVARAHGVPIAGGPATVLALPEVELVVNLTVPAAHAEVATAAVRAGKHVYGEKPIALAPAEAEKVLAEASERGLLVGNAPDTFLGAGLQSALRAVAAGDIGVPVAASTVVQGLGPEAWHPDPAFFYQRGGGPLFDLGPYYLTSLVALFGGVSRVAAVAARARTERAVGSGPKAGQTFPVDVPTHVSALIEFASGVRADAMFSFDSAPRRNRFEITGTEGTLAVPDPNTFGGPLELLPNGADEWRELPVRGRTDGRGLGVLDMARALRGGAAHRASGALALHVLQVMTAITRSADRSEFTRPKTQPVPPEPLPADWDPAEATLIQPRSSPPAPRWRG
ncbi:Gfo/Idh/MocA family protein [Streptomyces sp. NRRL S-1521]|uniref:Gfo/Idh/MocA family protein n=1 Tax=Streptomyces sp. NRRL S-1521 TaxID=1609100 RepID=UPI0007465C45|nr:Gfo/Idh/MocA family oxidoreductase [Streptomyces sp. NRRL S-1521]KUL47608.1 oxidoreductase [Streptomyces sp. NRRL S-1521]